MIAGLPMYDRPELRDAHDRFWAAIRANLGHGRESLSSPADMASFWQSDDLLFGQTCGMPYRTFLHDRVQLVGTPDYGIEGCPPGYYRSAVIVHADSEIREFGELAEKRIAYNEALSQSGWAAIIAEMEYADMRPSSGLQTHAHINSAQAVSKKLADFAAIDAHTWALMCRYQTDLTLTLRVVHWTSPTPALPYICAMRFDAQAIFHAVENALNALPPSDSETLGIRGIIKIAKQDYLDVPTPSSPCNLFEHP
jgi:ABC-type phosphate/phosphonate transport system substrate-binding protein